MGTPVSDNQNGSIQLLTDHAILLKRDNFDQILENTPAQEEALEELLQDMLTAPDGPWYVVFYRLTSGIPTWVVLNEEELQQKYNLDTVRGRFEHKFEKIAVA